MTEIPIQIRRLTPDDTLPYRAIRLEGLQRNPEAFSSTYEREIAQPVAWFSERLDSFEIFGAFHGAELVGVAGLAMDQHPKTAHKCMLWGMYVIPGARKIGVGRRLVEAVCEAARGRVEQIQMGVVAGNEAARRLYASVGFVEYGIEKDAFKLDGQYWDNVLMAKFLMDEER